jgi:aquaporin Z
MSAPPAERGQFDSNGSTFNAREEVEMPRYATEFVGTFFFVFSIALAVDSGSVLAPLAIGTALMTVVYMGGYISGGHYNPAVSLAVMLRGKLSGAELLPYWASQVFGGLLGAFVASAAAGRTFAPAPAPTASVIAVLIVEVVFTCLLCLVVLNVATTKATAGNSYYGLAIGFVIVVGATAGGPISGGAFNPAVATAGILNSAMRGAGTLGNLWYYWLAPLAGGAIAAGIFGIQGQE